MNVITVENLVGTLNIYLEQKKVEKKTIVDVNLGGGQYLSLENIDVQEWKDRDGKKHKVLTLKTRQYTPNDSIIS